MLVYCSQKLKQSGKSDRRKCWKGLTLVDKYNEHDRDQTSEPHSWSNRCDFLSLLQLPSNQGWIMRPKSRRQRWKHRRGNGQTKCYTWWKKRAPGLSAAPVRDHTTCRRSVGGVRLTKAPTSFNQTLPSVSAYCLPGNAAAEHRKKDFFTPTSTSSCYSNTLTNHWFIHCLYTSQSPPLRPSSRPHRQKHPQTAGLTLPPWRPPLYSCPIGRPAVRLILWWFRWSIHTSNSVTLSCKEHKLTQT